MIFISHSNRDLESAETVCAALESAGNMCWLARRDVGPGEEWLAAILEAIEAADTVVLIFSVYANQSPQVRREVAHAARLDRRLRVLRLDAAEPSGVFRLFANEFLGTLPASVAFEDRLEAICNAILTNDDVVARGRGQLTLTELLSGIRELAGTAVRVNLWIDGVRFVIAIALTVQVFVDKLTLEDTLSYAAFGLPLHFAGLMWVIVSLSVWVATAQLKHEQRMPGRIWRAFFRPLSFFRKPGSLLRESVALETRNDALARAGRACWVAISLTSIFSLVMLVLVSWDNLHPLAVLIPDLAISTIWFVGLGMTRKVIARL